MFALSPVRLGLIVTVTGGSSSAGLAPATWAPGPRDFAVRARHCSSGNAAHVHRIPPHDRDDAFAPLAEAGQVQETMIFRKTEEKYFCKRGLDRIFLICPTGKSIREFFTARASSRSGASPISIAFLGIAVKGRTNGLHDGVSRVRHSGFSAIATRSSRDRRLDPSQTSGTASGRSANDIRGAVPGRTGWSSPPWLAGCPNISGQY
jgi:hypothetical protein